MPSSEAKAERSPSARERLLAAAERLFYREGIQAVGIDAIIREAGVAKMSLYNNFASKDDLVAAYLSDKDGALRAGTAAAMAAAGERPRERILAVFGHLERWFASDEFRGCAFLNAAAELPEGHPGREVCRAHKRWLLETLRVEAERGGAADPAALALRLLMLADGAVEVRTVGVGGSPAAEARAAAAALLDVGGIA